MRFRLGLLQDSAALEKQAAREAAEAQAKKHKSEAPTVKTEAQTKADEVAEARLKDSLDKAKEPKKKPKIRPLSEAKAIDVRVVPLICLDGLAFYPRIRILTRRVFLAGLELRLRILPIPRRSQFSILRNIPPKQAGNLKTRRCCRTN